ncbi:glycosyltransferase [Pyrobaculum sp.]|uniref:glycosyltransferase n=1 Tax=Pyrobaculum sp. TaxID=2004705 RepID=UPI003172BE48
MSRICAFVRHPTFKEGQTALAMNYLRALRMIYGRDLRVIETTGLSPVKSKYGIYLAEALAAAFNDCDVVHLLNTNKVLPAFINGLLSRKRVISYQFSYLPKIHSAWKVKRAIIEHGSNFVVGSSERIAGLFRNGVFINPPINTELFKPRDKALARRLIGLPIDGKIVGYVGDVDERRGFDIVARLASAANNDVKFLIASLRVDNISGDTLRALARAIRRGTVLLMFREAPIWYVYNAIDVLLLPIRGDYPTEPPMTLLEALSSGTPVIGSLSPSMVDYRGLYIGVKDDEWDDILSLLHNEKLLDEYSKKAREYVMRYHKYDVVADKLKL